MSVQVKVQRGGTTGFWPSTKPAEKVSRDMGDGSDSMAISHDIRPLG